jgi:phenylalanyl-tRNA synthetase beta chain
MGDGKISLAYSLTFRAAERTLTGAEIAQVREAAVAQAVKDCGAILRTA